jgi:ring-1,2-phenylacetyl-CoA epoxidase subunit PaaA
MAVLTDEALISKIKKGYLVERPEEMTENYKKALIQIMLVSADTELMSAPAYYMAACKAPSINTRLSAFAIIQDEMGHAHIAFRLLEDLGLDKAHLVYGRKPHEFKNPYGFDQSLDSWVELIVANAFFDRAGIILLGDIFKHTSYGPWRRALAKVDKEELFHLRHGEVWMERLCKAEGKAKQEIQRAVDWMFPMGAEWFGLPDTMKRHSAQLEFQLKGYTNDQLRQQWLSAVVPLCERCGLSVPARKDEKAGHFVLDYPIPIDCNAEEKRWLFDKPITWEQAFDRWRRRGPYNQKLVHMFQKEFAPFMKLYNGNSYV